MRQINPHNCTFPNPEGVSEIQTETNPVSNSHHVCPFIFTHPECLSSCLVLRCSRPRKSHNASRSSGRFPLRVFGNRPGIFLSTCNREWNRIGRRLYL